MPKILFPLVSPKILPAAQEQLLGTPGLLIGKIPFVGEFQADNTTNIFVNRILPMPLQLRLGPANLFARFPTPPSPAPPIDPKPDPVPPMPYPVQFMGGIGSRAFSRKFSKALFSSIVPTRLLLSGVTRDSTGVILGSCTVHLFKTLNDQFVDLTVSDAVTGAYSFTTTGMGQTYYVVAYKVGVPDVSGTTLNTLIGV